jgi:hypothetical protein
MSKVNISTILLVSCILLTALGHHQAYAQQVVTTGELSDVDVKEAVKSLTIVWGMSGNWYGPRYPGHQPSSIKVLGIHQEGNSATVYCQFMDNQHLRTGSIKLIRFTSGKWYCPWDETFVSR